MSTNEPEMTKKMSPVYNLIYLLDTVRLSHFKVLIEYSLTVKAATLMIICGRGSAISSAKQGKSGSVYLVIS